MYRGFDDRSPQRRSSENQLAVQRLNYRQQVRVPCFVIEVRAARLMGETQNN